MRGLHWRWVDKDFGFRFRSGVRGATAEYYQARDPGTFYVVPAKQRKIQKHHIDELASGAPAPISPKIVPIPWQNYERDWDWITTENDILLNYAGCLDPEELRRREDEGVARAMELVNALLERPEPVACNLTLIRQLHTELMGTIYPFAGNWRSVTMHKGDGPTRWPLPPGGIGPLMDVFERDVLSRTPFLSENNDDVFDYVSEVMCELLAIHPFREGNGRTAFILGSVLLMQNDLLPLDVYDRRKDETRYFAACDAGRIHRNYKPLSNLLAEWEIAATSRWEANNAG